MRGSPLSLQQQGGPSAGGPAAAWAPLGSAPLDGPRARLSVTASCAQSSQTEPHTEESPNVLPCNCFPALQPHCPLPAHFPPRCSHAGPLLLLEPARLLTGSSTARPRLRVRRLSPQALQSRHPLIQVHPTPPERGLPSPLPKAPLSPRVYHAALQVSCRAPRGTHSLPDAEGSS